MPLFAAIPATKPNLFCSRSKFQNGGEWTILKEAILWEQAAEIKLRCNVCAYSCMIHPRKLGNCRTRKNLDVRVFSLIYGTVTSIAGDPI